jgi:hypothetical protein
MPTVCYVFDKSFSSACQVMRDERWRRIRRDARGSRPLRIVMIKTQSMIMVRQRVDS